MKPTKNRHFCLGAKKDKINFQSHKEAKRFLYYNAQEATDEFGRKPCRIYYCQSCMAYHVTSQIVGRHKGSFLQVYGPEKGADIYGWFDSLTEGKRQMEPILKKNIKELKRLMRFDDVEYDRCEEVINETMSLFELGFRYGIGDSLSVHNLFERFATLCNRYKACKAAA